MKSFIRIGQIGFATFVSLKCIHNLKSKNEYGIVRHKVFASSGNDTVTTQITGSNSKIREFKKLEESPEIEKLSLHGSVIIFRHGARTPISAFLQDGNTNLEVNWDADLLLSGVAFTDAKYRNINLNGKKTEKLSSLEERYKKTFFKGGCCGGQLTNVGRYQVYQLGLDLKQRYIEEKKLIPEAYDKKYIRVQATNCQRTIDSARCVIAGMFGVEPFDEDPLQIIVNDDDSTEFLYPNPGHCPCLKDIEKRAFKYAESMEGMEEVVNKLNTIFGYTGKNKKKMYSMIHTRDNIVARLTHGLPIPDGLDEETLKIIDQFATAHLALRTTGTEEDRLLGLKLACGLLWNQIFSNLEEISQSDNQHPSLYLISAHDSTLLPLLVSMNEFDGKWPPYAADIRIEIFQDSFGDPWVRVLYNGEQLKLPNCDRSLCTLEEFRESLNHVTINRETYKKLCNVKSQRSSLDRVLEWTTKSGRERNKDSSTPAGL